MFEWRGQTWWVRGFEFKMVVGWRADVLVYGCGFGGFLERSFFLGRQCREWVLGLEKVVLFERVVMWVGRYGVVGVRIGGLWVKGWGGDRVVGLRVLGYVQGFWLGQSNVQFFRNGFVMCLLSGSFAFQKGVIREGRGRVGVAGFWLCFSVWQRWWVGRGYRRWQFCLVG